MATESDLHQANSGTGGAMSVATTPAVEQTHVAHDPLDPAHVMGHVKDADYFQFPRVFSESTGGKVFVPQFRISTEPIVVIKTGFEPFDNLIEPLDFRVTKFMVLEVVGAILVAAIFIPLANRIKSGRPPRGRLWNFFEVMVVFVREQIARTAIGAHDGDRFAPFLLTLFFFILACNLLGLVPWSGSPTAALGATGALAVVCYITMVGVGIKQLGGIHYWTAQIPHMDVPVVMGVFLKPMIFALEVLGMLIKHFVLSVRLLANMVAGHMVLAVMVALIGAAAYAGLNWMFVYMGVAPVCVLASVALSMLELFVAFLQAYIFVFLAGLFIGMAVHPH